MDQGASACAGGVEGACDAVYLPEFFWPGIVCAVIALMVLIVLHQRGQLKQSFRGAIVVWVISVALFGAINWSQRETELDRTLERAGLCANSDEPTCEF